MAIDRARLLSSAPVAIPVRYTRRDTMLHGLAVGLGMDPLDEQQLRFVYDDQLEVFPTMSAVLGWADLVRDRRFHDPAWGVDGDRMVVAQIEISALAPLPPEGFATARTAFAEVIDKGEGHGALLRTRKDLIGPSGKLLATLDSWLMVRGAGGFGGPREGGPLAIETPGRAPDFICDLKTPENLALLYRLVLGDHNAVHADPAFARGAGFERPILHGIANLSIAVHAVLRRVLDYDTRRFRAATGRMSAPVFPGDTLRNQLWIEGDAVLFRTTALERNVVVMAGGKVDIGP